MHATPYNIDIPVFAQLRADGTEHALLDVREPHEIAICAISDSLEIPMREIPQHVGDLPRDRPLFVLCHHGIRSAAVTNYLRDSGFDNAWNLAGGIDAWAQLIEPGMARY